MSDLKIIGNNLMQISKSKSDGDKPKILAHSTSTKSGGSKLGSKYCLARWCSNSKSKNCNITLFRLPMKKDHKRAFQWLKNADRDDLKDKSFSYLHLKYLCSDHFTEDMFMNSATKNSLKWNAIPELFPVPQNISSANKCQSARDDSDRQLVAAYTSRHRLKPVCPKYDTTSLLTSRDGICSIENDEQLNTSERDTEYVETLHSEMFEVSDCTETNNVDLWRELFETYGNAIEINYNEACDSIDRAVSNELETATIMSTGVSSDPTCVLDLADHTGSSDMMHACPSCGEMFLAMSDSVRHQRSFHYQNASVP